MRAATSSGSFRPRAGHDPPLQKLDVARVRVEIRLPAAEERDRLSG